MKAWAYKYFKIGDLFDIKKGKRLTKAAMKPGNVSFIGSSASNHGITAKIANDSCLHPENTITVSYNGSVGEVFYQTEKFWASDDINVLYSKHVLNEPIALYYCTVIRKCGKKYGYAYKWTKEFMEQDCIPLPITKAGEIDFAFMESRIREMEQSRIREMEQSRIREMEAYLKVAGFDNCELTEEEKKAVENIKQGKVTFKTFYITDDKKNKRSNSIFNVKNSHNILQSSIVAGSGTTPYVTAGDGNNSIYAYISFDKNQIEEGNAIMIGGKTMVITYQAKDFFSNDSHNLVLYAKDENLKKELIQLFMVASLNKSLKPIYSWGDSISKAKIIKDKFNLPVTSTGSIDYKFMETYIRAIEKLTIQRVLDWRAKEIATTKTVVNEGKNVTPLQPRSNSKQYEFFENDTPKMVAEDI